MLIADEEILIHVCIGKNLQRKIEECKSKSPFELQHKNPNVREKCVSPQN